MICRHVKLKIIHWIRWTQTIFPCTHRQNFLRQPHIQTFQHSDVWAYRRSDGWAFGRSDVRTFGRSDVRTFGRSDVRAFGRPDVRTFGSMDVWMLGHSAVWTFGRSLCKFSAVPRLGGGWTRQQVIIATFFKSSSVKPCLLWHFVLEHGGLHAGTYNKINIAKFWNCRERQFPNFCSRRIQNFYQQKRHC